MLPFHCPKAVPFCFLITQYSIVYVLFEKYKTFSVLIHNHIKTIGNLVKRELCGNTAPAHPYIVYLNEVYTVKRKGPFWPHGAVLAFQNASHFGPPWGRNRKQRPFWLRVGLFWLLFKSCFSSVKSQILSVFFLCLNNVLL